jgi:glycosyltransferase involved in cell wall biosynthesis
MATNTPVEPYPAQSGFLKNKDIVVISISDWEGPKRIRQFLSEELVRQGNRVLFVESQYTLSKFLKKPSLPRAFRFLNGPRQIANNIHLLTTIPFIPGGEFSGFLSRTNWNLERTFLRSAMKQLEFRNPILLMFAYNAKPLIGKLGESLSIYFCNDAFSLLVESKALQQRVASLEHELLGSVNTVFTVSEKLSEEKAQFHTPVYTIHHGVDVRLFRESLRAPKPADMPTGSPVIGYSGVIRYMIDLEMIRFLAEQRPEWKFVMVGPVTESSADFYSQIEILKLLPNVHFLGSKRAEDLPPYINAFDVCLLPYVLDEVSTYYAAPLKFYEYLAAGKPVVSTVGPRQYDRDVVLNCSTKEEVLRAIQEALSKNSPDLATKRMSIAAENSWEQRFHEIDQILSRDAKHV